MLISVFVAYYKVLKGLILKAVPVSNTLYRQVRSKLILENRKIHHGGMIVLHRVGFD